MEVIVAVALFFFILFFGPLLGTLVGAFVGFVVGLFFDGTLALLATAIGIEGAAPWQLGAILGFVSGFFANKQVSSK